MSDSATILTLPIDFQIEAVSRFSEIFADKDVSSQSEAIHKTLEELFNKLQMNIIDIKCGALKHVYASEDYDLLLADITKLRSISERLYLLSLPVQIKERAETKQRQASTLQRKSKPSINNFGIRINSPVRRRHIKTPVQTPHTGEIS